MDIESIKQGLAAIGMALTTLKQAKDLLPENTKKQEISNAIADAERQLKIAESQTAQALGYVLCKDHFPPEIMLSKDDRIWKCPKCGNEKSKNQGNKFLRADFYNK